MRASTLFACTVAILLGLGVVAAAKYAGLFNRQPPAETKVEPIQVLVADKNLFEGITLTAADVRVRALKPEEVAHYQANKDKYLPPLVQAASLRILAKNVEADQPILKEYLQDNSIPNSVSARLEPGMRAVNVSVPKDRAAGGLIQLGERVDVLLTSKICDGLHCEAAVTKTACIARDLKVIVKRNNLWTVMAPNPDDRPVNLTLQANPYRAALIEFAQQKGLITLVPVPATTSRRSSPGTQSDPESPEYADEDTRVARLTANALTIGDSDLERIFNLAPLPPRVPPVMVRRVDGLTYRGDYAFGPGGIPVSMPSKNDSATGNNNNGSWNSYRPRSQDGGALGYQFHSPATPAAPGTGVNPPPGGT